MKTLNDYMAMSYKMEIVEDKDEGGFVVSYPDLPGCITCGETVEKAESNIWLISVDYTRDCKKSCVYRKMIFPDRNQVCRIRRLIGGI